MASLFGNLMGAVGPWALNAVAAQPQYNNLSDEQYNALFGAGVKMATGGVQNDNWFAPTIGQQYMDLAALGRNNRINSQVSGILADPEVQKEFVSPTSSIVAPPPSNFKTGSVAPSKLVTLEGPGGAKFQVASQYEPNFKGLVEDLAAAGYTIDPASSGGYANRTIKLNGKDTGIPSKHAFGGAIDTNWNANPVGGRPVSQRGFTGKGSQPIDPTLARTLAAKHGLIWGGDFKDNPDPMHFEAPGNFNRTASGARPPFDKPSGLGGPVAQPVAAATEAVGGNPPPVAPTTAAPAAEVPVQQTGGLSGRITDPLPPSDPGVETPQPYQVAQTPDRNDPRFIAQGPPGSGVKVPMEPTLGGLKTLEAFLRSGGLSDKDRFEIMSKIIQSHGPQATEGYGGKVVTDKHSGQTFIIPGFGNPVTYSGNIPGIQNYTPEGKPFADPLLPGTVGTAGAPQTPEEQQRRINELARVSKQFGGVAGAAEQGKQDTESGGKLYQQYQSAFADSQRSLSQETRILQNIDKAAQEGKLPGLRGAWRDKVYQGAKIFESLTGRHIDKLASKETLATDDLIKMFQAEGMSREARSLASQILSQQAKVPNFDDTVEGMKLKTQFLMSIHKMNIDIANHVYDITDGGKIPMSESALHRSVGTYLEMKRKIEDAQEEAEKLRSQGGKPAKPTSGVLDDGTKWRIKPR